jgi:hypothetical protein
MGLSIKVEWLDAPEIQDIVDAVLWARLEIVAKGIDGSDVVLTEAIDSKTGQIRRGIYGSLFPLARWVVDSYWSLLWEISRTPYPRSGRDSARFDLLRPWVQRHCLLAAREGFSLPDLTIASDGDHVVLSAYPDRGAEKATRRPVSFISDAILRVDRRAVDTALREFMDSVIERLRGVEHPDTERLRTDWSATIESDHHEARLCTWAARLGIDPYDEAALDVRTVEFMEDHLSGLSEGLRTDLLDAAIGCPELIGAVTWLKKNSDNLHGLAGPSRADSKSGVRLAHETGYSRARSLRKDLGMGASDGNVVGVVGSRFGYDFSRERELTPPTPAPLESLVGANGGQVPILVGESLAHAPRAFRWARGLYLWQFGHLREGPRLLTRSHERLQREGRAFAAEFLAPAAALRRHIHRENVCEQEVTDIATSFNVSPVLIRHQIENHRLAILD